MEIEFVHKISDTKLYTDNLEYYEIYSQHSTLNVSGTSFKCLCKPGTQPTALAADLLATSSSVTGLCTRLPAPAPGQARTDMLPMLHDMSIIPSWTGGLEIANILKITCQ